MREAADLSVHRVYSEKQSRDQCGRGEAPGTERRGGKVGELVGSQALESPEGRSEHSGMYLLGRSVQGFTGGKKYRAMELVRSPRWTRPVLGKTGSKTR